jgi:hypothetical protein
MTPKQTSAIALTIGEIGWGTNLPGFARPGVMIPCLVTIYRPRTMPRHLDRSQEENACPKNR